MKGIEALINASGEEHDPEVVSYGFSILKDGLVTLMLIMGLGVVTNHILESVIYLVSHIIGTATMGGYHCTTIKRCYILTIILWIVLIIATEWVEAYKSPSLILWTIILSLIAVVRYAPATHINKPVSDFVYRRNRRNAILLDIGMSLLIVTLYLLDNKTAGVFLINKVEIIIVMILGKGIDVHVSRKRSKACSADR